MKTQVFSITTDRTVRDAVVMMVEHHIGCLPVVDGENRLVGVIYQRDLLSLVIPSFVRLVSDFAYVHDFGVLDDHEPSVEELSHPVSNVMRPPLKVCDCDSILLAVGLLHKNGIADLPVVDESDHLVGLVSHVDIGGALMQNWLD
jgi:CBS domain-containing protein